MKILLTGCSAAQNNDASTGNVNRQSSVLKQMFTSLGHEVHHKRVPPGFNADEYDLLVLGLVDPKSISANYQIGVLDLAGRYDNLIFFMDDLKKNIQVPFAKIKANHSYCSTLIRDYGDLLTKWWPTYTAGIDKVVNMRHPFLASMKDNGNKDQVHLNTSGTFLTYDPHPFLVLPPIEANPHERLRAWSVASLISSTATFVRKQRELLEWEVLYYGHKTEGEGRITETEQLAVLSAIAGNLQVPHNKINGAGWWRKTLWFSQATGTVLSMNQTEAALWGEPYQRASDPRTVEQLTTAAREALVREQRDCFWANVSTKERELRKLEELLTSEGY